MRPERPLDDFGFRRAPVVEETREERLRREIRCLDWSSVDAERTIEALKAEWGDSLRALVTVMSRVRRPEEIAAAFNAALDTAIEVALSEPGGE